jgi:hypothetical protein
MLNDRVVSYKLMLIVGEEGDASNGEGGRKRGGE